MAKGSLMSDTFEQLAELGQSTAQKTTQSVKQIIDPMKLMEQVTGKSHSSSDHGIEKLEKDQGKNQNNTPLDFNKLRQTYGNQDKQKSDALANRLFQLVKSGEEKAIYQNKKEEEEKKRQIAYEKQDKKRRTDQQKQQQSAGDLPEGKRRQSIFSHKKVAKREQTEVRPSSGKQ